MNRPKSTQIPNDLLYDLFRYHLLGETDEDTEDAIRTALEAKLEAMVKHDLYTQSKTADTPEAREAARQAYLDRVGMRASYRYGPEGLPEPPD